MIWSHDNARDEKSLVQVPFNKLAFATSEELEFWKLAYIATLQGKEANVDSDPEYIGKVADDALEQFRQRRERVH